MAIPFLHPPKLLMRLLLPPRLQQLLVWLGARKIACSIPRSTLRMLDLVSTLRPCLGTSPRLRSHTHNRSRLPSSRNR